MVHGGKKSQSPPPPLNFVGWLMSNIKFLLSIRVFLAASWPGKERSKKVGMTSIKVFRLAVDQMPSYKGLGI